MKRSAVILIAAVVVIVVVAAVVLKTYWVKRIPSYGFIKKIGVGVYADPECSINVTRVDWGVCDPGSSKNFSVYVRNECNVNGSLTLNTTDWLPEIASNYLTVTWDAEGLVMDPLEVVLATITLWISPDVQGFDHFSFYIVLGVVA